MLGLHLFSISRWKICMYVTNQLFRMILTHESILVSKERKKFTITAYENVLRWK